MNDSLLLFPEIPLNEWRATKNTLHLYLQIIGKIRLRTHPQINHWWHVPLYVSPRGLTTRTIPYAGGNFEIEFDFKDHELKMRTSDGRVEDPDAAQWNTANGVMALLMYDDIRNLENPRETALNFLKSAYQAGAKTAGWDADSFRLRSLGTRG